MTLAAISGPLPWIALAAAAAVFLLADLRFFARGRAASLREAAAWTAGWTLLSLFATLPLWAASSGHDALAYLTVYLVTRSLSFDNLFVFILLFAYFGVPREARAKLLTWGIVGALVLRALAILGGLALIHRLHFVVYVLGALLLVLAWRILSGVEENVHPDRNLFVRLVRRIFPVAAEGYSRRLFLRRDGRLYTTPLFLCLAAVVTADAAFAIDSIPAAFAITGDSFLIWMGNVFALLGLRALFVLVSGLMQRFRFLDHTLAVLLALVGLELILDRVVHVGTGVTLAAVAGVFAAGVAASILWGDRFRRDGPGAPGRAGPPPRHR